MEASARAMGARRFVGAFCVKVTSLSRSAGSTMVDRRVIVWPAGMMPPRSSAAKPSLIWSLVSTTNALPPMALTPLVTAPA